MDSIYFYLLLSMNPLELDRWSHWIRRVKKTPSLHHPKDLLPTFLPWRFNRSDPVVQKRGRASSGCRFQSIFWSETIWRSIYNKIKDLENRAISDSMQKIAKRLSSVNFRRFSVVWWFFESMSLCLSGKKISYSTTTCHSPFGSSHF